MSSNSGKFTKYSINTFIVSICVSALSVVTLIITARYLGKVGKGQLTLLIIIPTFAVTFGRMGLSHSINYYASKVSPTKLIVNSIVLSSFLSLILLLIAIPLVYFTKDMFFKGIGTREIIFICFTIPFFMYYDVLPAIMQGMYKINKSNFLNSMQPLLYLLLLIVLILILKLGLLGAIISYASALVVTAILSLTMVFREINIKEIGFDFSFMRKLLNYGLKSHVGSILKQLSYRSDVLLVAYFLNPAAVGLYIVAVNVAETIWKLPEAVGSVLLPKVAQMNKNDAKEFTPTVFRVVSFPVILSCLGIFFFGKKIMILALGQTYLPSVSVLMLLLPGILSLSFWKILANDLIAQGHAMKYSITSGIALVVMLLMDVILIPRFGINGAAIASTISYVAATVYIIFLYKKISGNSFKLLFIPVRSDFTVYKKLIPAKIKLKIF